MDFEIPSALNLDYHFLGFYAADGTHLKGRLRFFISNKDKAILDIFQTYYGGTRSEYSYNNGVSYYSVPISRFEALLKKVGIPLWDKSHRLEHIRLEGANEFLSFLLGYIDGDGSVAAKSQHRVTRISLVAYHREFVNSIWHLSKKFCGIASSVNRNKMIWELVYTGRSVQALARSLLPYLIRGLRKHEAIRHIALYYDYDAAHTFHHKLTAKEYAEMVELRKQGMSYGKIAAKYNVSKQSAMKVIKRRLKGR